MSYNQTCKRCGEPCDTFKMSWFNTEMICKKCQAQEEKKPRYKEAKRKELEEVKRGNYNFDGIGL